MKKFLAVTFLALLVVATVVSTVAFAKTDMATTNSVTEPAIMVTNPVEVTEYVPITTQEIYKDSPVSKYGVPVDFYTDGNEVAPTVVEDDDIIHPSASQKADQDIYGF